MKLLKSAEERPFQEIETLIYFPACSFNKDRSHFIGHSLLSKIGQY